MRGLELTPDEFTELHRVSDTLKADVKVPRVLFRKLLLDHATVLSSLDTRYSRFNVPPPKKVFKRK